MNKPLIIGISGKIGSGKDTIGEYLRDKYNFKIESLALNVRRVCSILTGIPLEVLLTREAKGIKVNYENKVITIGEMLQIVGNGLRESIHEDIWVNSLLSGLDKTQNVVITDVRYPNEYKEIQKRGGILIRVEGDPSGIKEAIRSGKSLDKRDLNAPSETALDQFAFPYVIFNDKSKQDLYDKIDNILKLGHR